MAANVNCRETFWNGTFQMNIYTTAFGRQKLIKKLFKRTPD